MNMDGMDPQRLEQQRQLEVMKKQLLSGILTREAFERLSRVRMVNPEIAGQLEGYLIQMHQSGGLPGKIDDGKLREILRIITSKRQMRIKRA